MVPRTASSAAQSDLDLQPRQGSLSEGKDRLNFALFTL